MPKAKNGSVELEYETLGSADDPVALMIMGFTAPLTYWDDKFCQKLVDRGLFVVRFDNRDVGLSSKTKGLVPDLMALMVAAQAGQRLPEVPYTLSDMAGDAMAVLDAVGAEQANIVGASMGGMIAQVAAIEHPDRVASLTSIMSTTGNPEVGQATSKAMDSLFSPMPKGREAVIERGVEISKILTGAHFDKERARKRVAVAYDRCFHPEGAAFQMAAIAVAEDRTKALGQLDMPALVIHGGADPLIQPSGGEATAAAIPHCRLLMFDDMGHDLAPAYWDDMVDAIATVALDPD